MSALIAASDGQGASFGALMRFLFNTGARLSEALALRWRDVDLDKESFAYGKRKRTRSARQ